MKILILCSLLCGLLAGGVAFAGQMNKGWPFSDLLLHECEDQSRERLNAQGFICTLVDDRTLWIWIGDKSKASLHRQHQVVGYFALAGGSSLQFVDMTEQPVVKTRVCTYRDSTRRHSRRQGGGTKRSSCSSWEVATDEWKKRVGLLK